MRKSKQGLAAVRCCYCCFAFGVYNFLSLFEWLRVTAIKTNVFRLCSAFSLALVRSLSLPCHPFLLQCTLVYNFVVIAKDALHIKVQNKCWKRNFSIWIRIAHTRIPKKMSCLRFRSTFFAARSQFSLSFYFRFFYCTTMNNNRPMLYWHSLYQVECNWIFVPLRINSIAQWYCL